MTAEVTYTGLLAKVDRLEHYIDAADQIDLKTTHVLCGGLYARSFTVPAGVAVVGATHKTDHVDVMQGDVSFTTPEGVKRLTGMHVLATKAGAKRVGYAHSETKWTTICKTDLIDIPAIEAELVVEAEKLQTRRFALEGRDIYKLENQS